ncbi:MAG: hypothetical protein IJ222_04870 [Bacteroidales bacterium]|nr:hypothetical protein [Bacteroidales bacterium]
MLSLYSVKSLVLILSLALSFFLGEKDRSTAWVAASSPSEKQTDQALNREICFTAAQGYTFAGSESSNFISFRTAQGGRRTSSQTRSNYRFVKCGKVIDNNHLHPFLSQPVLSLGGTHISERYLFVLCTLRL